MQVSCNGEEEARLVRRTENESQYIFDSDLNRESGSESFGDGREPIRVNRVIRSPEQQSIAISRRKRTDGKILSQLISEYQYQVASKKQEIDHLETKLQELEALQRELEESEDT